MVDENWDSGIRGHLFKSHAAVIRHEGRVDRKSSGLRYGFDSHIEDEPKGTIPRPIPDTR